MPQHYGQQDLRIVTQSSPTGTQFLQAVGCSMSRKWEITTKLFMFHLEKEAQARANFMKH